MLFRSPDNLWRLRLCLARCEFLSSKSELALETCREALARLERSGDRLGQARFHEESARIQRSMNDTRATLSHLERAVECHGATGDRHGLIDDLLLLAELDADSRRRRAEEALALAMRIGYGAGLSRARRLLDKA